MLESLRAKEMRIIEFFMKSLGKGSFFSLFEIIISLLLLPLFAIIIATAAALFIALFSKLMPTISDPTALEIINFLSNPILLIVLVILSIISIILILVVGYLVHQFTKYLMFIEGVGPFGGFLKSISLLMGNLVQVVVLIVIQVLFMVLLFFIGLVLGILVAIPLIIAGAIIGIVMLATQGTIISVLLAFLNLLIVVAFFYVFITILSPISAFFFNYDMAFLELLLGKGKAIKGVKATKSVNAAGTKQTTF